MEKIYSEKGIALPKKLFIPKIDDNRLIELSKKLKPIIKIGETKYFLREFTLDELRTTSYVWYENKDKREQVDLSKLETIDEFSCLHKWGYYDLFKPSIAEILAQMPEKLIPKSDTFEIVESPKTIIKYENINNHTVIGDYGELFDKKIDILINDNQNTAPPLTSSSTMVKQPEIKNQYDYNLNKSSIDSFLNDILYSSKSPDFRGWVLPNGQLLSTFVAPIIINDRVRQDHGIIAKLFISGLESYDKEAYNRMKFLYDEYCKKNQDAYDIYESFAVEVLGWIQVSSFGKKELLHWENAGKIN